MAKINAIIDMCVETASILVTWHLKGQVRNVRATCFQLVDMGLTMKLMVFMCQKIISNYGYFDMRRLQYYTKVTSNHVIQSRNMN